MARSKRRGPRVVEMEMMTVQRGGREGPKGGDLSRGLVQALEAVRERRRERGMSPRAERVARRALDRTDRALGRDDMEPFTLEEVEGPDDMSFTLEEAEGRPRRERVRSRVMERTREPLRRLYEALDTGSLGELRRRALREGSRDRGAGDR